MSLVTVTVHAPRHSPRHNQPALANAPMQQLRCSLLSEGDYLKIITSPHWASQSLVKLRLSYVIKSRSRRVVFADSCTRKLRVCGSDFTLVL